MAIWLRETYFLYKSQSYKYSIVQRVDERDKEGNKEGSDKDELERYLYGVSVCLWKILER